MKKIILFIFCITSSIVSANSLSQFICGEKVGSPAKTVVGYKMPVSEAIKIDRLYLVLIETYSEFEIDRFINERRQISFTVSYPSARSVIKDKYFKIDQFLHAGADIVEASYGNDKLPWVSDYLVSKISSLNDADDEDKTVNLSFKYQKNRTYKTVGNLTTSIEGDFALYTHRYNALQNFKRTEQRLQQRFTEQNQLKAKVQKRFYRQVANFYPYVEFAIGIQENNSDRHDVNGFMVENQADLHYLFGKVVYQNVPSEELSSLSVSTEFVLGFKKDYLFGSKCLVSFKNNLLMSYDSRGYHQIGAGLKTQFSYRFNKNEIAAWIDFRGVSHNANLIIDNQQLNDGDFGSLDFRTGVESIVEFGIAYRRGAHELSLRMQLDQGENYNPQVFNRSATSGKNKLYSELRYKYYIGSSAISSNEHLGTYEIDVIEKPQVIISSMSSFDE